MWDEPMNLCPHITSCHKDGSLKFDSFAKTINGGLTLVHVVQLGLVSNLCFDVGSLVEFMSSHYNLP